MNGLITKHQLDFETKPWYRDPNFTMFRVGTCEGLYRCTSTAYQILAIDNKAKGNGHLNDVFEWFEFSCKRDNRNLEVIEIMNYDFMKHLIGRRGFVQVDHENAIKKLKYI